MECKKLFGDMAVVSNRNVSWMGTKLSRLVGGDRSNEASTGVRADYDVLLLLLTTLTLNLSIHARNSTLSLSEPYPTIADIELLCFVKASDPKRPPSPSLPLDGAG
jgi:hypothetical protein